MLRVYFTSLLFIGLVVVSCGQKKKSFTSDRSDNLIPDEPIGYTSDFANQFSPSEVAELDSIIIAHNKETTNQIAIVTINVDSVLVPTEMDFHSLSVRLTKYWGVGTKEKNNGVGIVISPRLRMISICTGYGVEEKLTSAECQKIIDSIMIPSLKKDNFFEATRAALDAVIGEIK